MGFLFGSRTRPVPGAPDSPYLSKNKLFQPLPSPLFLLQLGRLMFLGLIPWYLIQDGSGLRGAFFLGQRP